MFWRALIKPHNFVFYKVHFIEITMGTNAAIFNIFSIKSTL